MTVGPLDRVESNSCRGAVMNRGVSWRSERPVTRELSRSASGRLIEEEATLPRPDSPGIVTTAGPEERGEPDSAWGMFMNRELL
jgi:hypothetical protein